MNALATQSKHVPYRNSKLTFLLQDSLSGDSKVLMFVNISPVQWNASETLCSLKFAERCSEVQLGSARRNVESAEVARMRKMIEDLRSRLGAASAPASGAGSASAPASDSSPSKSAPGSRASTPRRVSSGASKR